MRRMNVVFLAMVLLCTAAAWAAEPAAPTMPSAPAEVNLMTPAAPAPALDLFLKAPQDRIGIPCPPEPITSCESCFYFGQYLSYTCTTYCVNGVPRRTCGGCGSGCPQ